MCPFRFGSLIQRVDYGFVLPTLARLPIALGEHLARMRGSLNWMLDYDWRSMSRGERYVRRGTLQAMRMLMRDEGRRCWQSATRKRFQVYSREEWEACLLAGKHMRTIFRRSTFKYLDEFLKCQREGRGLVLLTCHFDSFVMGIVLLGMAGLRINAISSSVVEDPRVHPSVRRFYYDKYRNMERFMNGGKVVHFEKNLRFFYKALERGEAVVILADLPAGSRKTDVIVPFLGGTRRMAPGAWRMARKTDSALGAFVCLHEEPGRYRVRCHMEAKKLSEHPFDIMNALYAFLERQIRLRPDRWWASELLPEYESV